MVDKRQLGIGFFAGIAGVGTGFGMYGLGSEFIVNALGRVLLEGLPESVITLVRLHLGGHAMTMSLITSGLLLVALLGTISLVSYAVGERRQLKHEGVSGFLVSVVILGGILYAVTGSIGGAVGPAVVTSAVIALLSILPVDDDDLSSSDRRTVIGVLGGVGLYALLAHIIGFFRVRDAEELQAIDTEDEDDPDPEPFLQEGADADLDVDRLQPLVTPIEDHYEVSIEPASPDTDSETWRLDITGEVQDEWSIPYSHLRDMTITHRFNTLRCLSDDIDGELIGNALWTGVPMERILAAVQPTSDYAELLGADGYFYTVTREELESALLAWGMNGQELPLEHGYPARLIMQNRWGKLHVKWIEWIEFIDVDRGGFWEERGWEGRDKVNAVTKHEVTNRLDDGQIQLAGIAYAGTRGVATVEVSVDGGEQWNEATLSDPLEGHEDVWRQWEFTFEPTADTHDVLARTIDETGAMQTAEETGPFPDGATGWASVTITGRVDDNS